MLIRCPTCASGYDLAPEVLGDGRILRCAHCRDAWVHRAGFCDHDGPEIVAQASASRPSSTLDFRETEPDPRARRRFPPGMPPSTILAVLLRPILRAGLPARIGTPALAATLAAALSLGAGAAVAGKARVVERFPASAAVFATIGLPVNLSGLAIGELRSATTGGEGPTTLTLEGRLTNLRPDATAVPDLRIAVRDKGGRELYHWTAPAPKARLAAGETVLFRSRLTAPPRDGQDLAVSFAPAAPERRRVAEATPSDR